MKPKVLVTQPVPEEVKRYLEPHCDADYWEEEKAMPREMLLSRLGDVEGLMTTGGSIDDELLEAAPRLKIVSNISVGYNNFDVEAMKKRRVWGTHTPHVLDETVADLIFALILSAARRIPELDRVVKAGRWKKGYHSDYFGVDVHHANLGIVGMGRIGEAVARRAAMGFGMNVFYYNRNRKPEAERELGVKYASFEDILQTSDFLMLMTPLSEATFHLMGREQFQQMKKQAIFINASRGKTVDEKALIEALRNGWIRGAGLDVFEQEPVLPDNPLLQMDNVVTLPHIGSATFKTRNEMAMVAAQNLVDGLTGNVPKDVVPELRG